MGLETTTGAGASRSGRGTLLITCTAGLLAAGCLEVTGSDDQAVFGELSLRCKTRSRRSVQHRVGRP